MESAGEGKPIYEIYRSYQLLLKELNDSDQGPVYKENNHFIIQINDTMWQFEEFQF